MVANGDLRQAPASNVLATPAASTASNVTLVIEASTPRGSVALFRGQQMVQRCDVAMGVSRDDALFPAIVDILRREALSPTNVGAIVCGNGPGSFTSLRIAGALAKGLAHATGAHLFAVSSLALAAASHGHSGDFLVHADALRGERYCLAVHIDVQGIVSTKSDVTRTLAENLEGSKATVHTLAVYQAREDTIEPVVTPDAAMLFRVADWNAQGPVSLQSWEPAYGRLAEAQVKWEAVHQRPLPDR